MKKIGCDHVPEDSLIVVSSITFKATFKQIS